VERAEIISVILRDSSILTEQPQHLEPLVQVLAELLPEVELEVMSLMLLSTYGYQQVLMPFR
jgi:hypothetical protein